MIPDVTNAPRAWRSPLPAMRAARRRSSTGTQFWAARLLFLSIVAPAQISISIGAVSLNIYRVGIFVCLLMVVPAILKMKWRLPDTLIVSAGVWAAVALTVGQGTGWDSGPIAALELIAPYLIGRCSVTSIDDFRRLMRFGFPFVCLIAMIMVFEAVTRHAVFGVHRGAEDLMRYGLMRAPGPFAFPILAGVFCASFFSLFMAALTKGRRVAMAASVVGMLASISSGAFAVLLVQIGLMISRRLFKTLRMKNGWRLLFVVLAIVWVLVDIFSNRGALKVFISIISLSPATAYYRLLIWEYAGQAVLDHPLFGVGYGDWVRLNWMTTSIDTFWLATGVAYGLFVPIAIGLASLIIMYRAGAASRIVNESDGNVCFAFNASLAGLLISAFTVHYWSNIYIWFIMLIGMGMGSFAAISYDQHRGRARPKPLQMQTRVQPAPDSEP